MSLEKPPAIHIKSYEKCTRCTSGLVQKSSFSTHFHYCKSLVSLGLLIIGIYMSHMHTVWEGHVTNLLEVHCFHSNW